MSPITLALLLTMTLQAAPDTQEFHLDFDDGPALRFAVATPAGESDGPRPVILALHFGFRGERPSPGYGRNFLDLLVAPAFEDFGAILVAPDAPERSWTHPRSEKALLALIEHLEAHHPVDTDRIVLVGFSLGAIGTWHFTAQHPDLVSAAIVLAGLPALTPAEPRADRVENLRTFLDDPSWPPGLVETPFLVIHSRRDELFPVDLTSRVVKGLKKAGGTVDFVKVQGLGHYNTPGYVEYLKQGKRWLGRVWEE